MVAFAKNRTYVLRKKINRTFVPLHFQLFPQTFSLKKQTRYAKKFGQKRSALAKIEHLF